MSETILVVVEQREGKLNRVSWESLVAGQSLAAEMGWTLEAAVAGNGVSTIAGEVAAKKVAKVHALESPGLSPYTPEGFSAGLKQFNFCLRGRCFRGNLQLMSASIAIRRGL